MASVEGVRRLEFDWVPIFEKRSRTDESYFRDEIFSGFRFLITGDVLKNSSAKQIFYFNTIFKAS